MIASCWVDLGWWLIIGFVLAAYLGLLAALHGIDRLRRRRCPWCGRSPLDGPHERDGAV